MSLQSQAIPTSPSQVLIGLIPDVLQQIFEYVSRTDPLYGAMTISHVCGYWREVALRSPLMWSNIHIRLGLTDTTGSQLEQAAAYLERSRNVPIDFTIHASRDFDTEEEDLIRLHAYRFRSLNIEASDEYVAYLLWSQLEMDMPMPSLEVLETVITDSDSRIGIRKIAAIEDSETIKIIPPVSASDSVVCWDRWYPSGLTALTLETACRWYPSGLTALTLETACLWNKPDMDDIYNILATTCHSLQQFEYVGHVSSIDDAGVNRIHLEFPELRSLSIFCSDNMVPLLQVMIIPSLETLTLRDFVAYPTTIPTSTAEDIDTRTFDPDDIFPVIKQWTTIRRLEIYGIESINDDSEDLYPRRPELSDYLESLNHLTTLILYGIGAATSLAYALFRHEQEVEPLLPRLSNFLLAVTHMSPLANDDLSQYLIHRQRHQLPPLKKMSINLAYVQHMTNMHLLNILWENSDVIFIIEDPEVGKYIHIEDVERL